MPKRIHIAAAGLLLAASPCLAAENAPASDTRFHLEKTQEGYIRLDQRTGAISYCREDGQSLTCRMAADERTAFEQELDMLTKRVEVLEKAGREAAPTHRPTEAEIEQSLSIMERFMRRFMGLVNEFKGDGMQERDSL